MSNGARHGLGVLIGVIATPIIAVCLLYGTQKLVRVLRTFQVEGADRWIGAAILLVAALIIGLVAGSRVSPLASLIPGAVFAAAGLLWVAAPRTMVQHSGRDLLPRELYYGYTMLAPIGVLLVIGFGLVAASVAPSRWKARTGTAPRYGAPPPAPMGPPPMPGAPAPMGAPQPPPAPGQNPPWQGGAPQYGQPPAQPGTANPPPLPPAPSAPAAPSAPSAPSASSADDKPEQQSSRGDSDDDPPGDWTQMYGGNRPT